MIPSPSGRLLAAILATIAVVAACSGGAATPASPAAASAPIATPSVAAAATPTAPPAATTPAATPLAVAPTTYRGTVKGSGTVEFTVSPDGSKVTAFVTQYPSCYGGTFTVSILNSDVPEAVITAGVFTFGSTLAPPTFVTGRLLSGGRAEGTIEEAADNRPTVDAACKVRRVMTWSATSSAAAASPSSGSDIDPCSLLTAAEVTSALEQPASTPRSLTSYFPGVFNDGKFVICDWSLPDPTATENRSLRLNVCSCQVSVAQFDAWAKSKVAGTSVKAIQVTGIGERAYLLGPFGIVFLYHGIAVDIFGEGVPGLTNLPDATLIKNAKPYYTELAKKVISRLP